MPKHKKKYITIAGLVNKYAYHYYHSDAKHKPKCKCGNVLQKVFYVSNNAHFPIGWICRFCNTVLISNKYTLLKYRQEENNEINSRIRC